MAPNNGERVASDAANWVRVIARASGDNVVSGEAKIGGFACFPADF